VVSLLATGPKVRGLKPIRPRTMDFNDDKYLSQHDFFRMGSKAGGPILQHVKYRYSMKRNTCRLKSRTYLAKFLPASLQGVSAGYCQTVGKLGMIRPQMGKYNKSIKVAVYGTTWWTVRVTNSTKSRLNLLPRLSSNR
jgi:hypothetical protein